ncbi:MAG: EamA family transporter [Bacteroidota bacterium]
MIYIGLPTVEIVFFRTLLTTFILAGIILYAKHPFRYPKGDMFRMFSSGFLLSLFWILGTLAAKTANASVAAVGGATATLWVTLLSPLLTKQPPKAFQGLTALNAVVGFYIIFNSDFEYDQGLIYALLAGFVGAILMIQTATFSKHNFPPITVSFYQFFGACIGTSVFIPIYVYLLPELSNGQFDTSMSFKDAALIVFMVLTFSIFAWSMFVKIMQTTSPFTVALVNNLTPIYAIIIAIFFFGRSELMNIGFYIGVIMLLASVFAYPFLRRYYEQKHDI